MNNKNNKKQKISNKSIITALEKSNALLKTMNKDLVLSLQKHKRDLSNSSAQNASLKAELYDTILERNSLLATNLKLIELLKSLHGEALSAGKRIEDTLNPRDLERDRIVTKQSAMICPMVSGHVIHNPKVELRRLNFSDYPSSAFGQGTNTINLSPIVEERFMENSAVPRRLGHRVHMSQNVSSAGNRVMSEDSFYSHDNWPEEISPENENNSDVMYSEINNPTPGSSLPMEENSTPLVFDEAFQQPESDDRVEIDSKPSGSLQTIDENSNSSEPGRNSSENGRNSTTLLTINLMSPQNNPKSSNNPASPSVFVNVFPRKRKYFSKRSSRNGFTVSGINAGSSSENRESNCPSIIDYKKPIILLERHPALSESLRTSIFLIKEEINSEEVKPSISKIELTENMREKKVSQQRSPLIKSEVVEVSSEEAAAEVSRHKRRSSRNVKPINYRELEGLDKRRRKTLSKTEVP